MTDLTHCPYCGVEILPDEDRGGAVECCPKMADKWWSGAYDRARDALELLAAAKP